MSEPEAVGQVLPLNAAVVGLVFEDFFRQERPHLFGALVLITGNRQDAEDITQEAFCKVWERWDKVAGMQSVDGYLYTTALNLYRSRYRRSIRAAKRAFLPATSPDPLEAVIDRDEVWRALVALPPRQREAVVVTDLLGFTSEEAAEMLHVASGTVRTLASRAKASMKRDAVESNHE